MSSIFKIESNLHWNLFSLHKEIIEHSHSLWFPRKGTPIVIVLTLSPTQQQQRSNRKEAKTKQYSNSRPIVKIYLHIIFELT